PNPSSPTPGAEASTSAAASRRWRRPTVRSPRTAGAGGAPASRSATSPASRSPSFIPAIFWAHWSSSKSRKGEERDEDQAHRADRGQLSHEEAGLHGGRRGQTGGTSAPLRRSR